MLILSVNSLKFIHKFITFYKFLIFFDKNRRMTAFALRPFGLGENFLFDDFKNIAIL